MGLLEDFGTPVESGSDGSVGLLSDFGVQETPVTTPSKGILETAKDVGLGTAETALSLIGGPVGWMAETGAKWGTAGLGHLGNLLAQVSGDKYGLRATPEEIMEASKMLASEQVGSKFYQPQTELGQQATELVGRGLETALAPAKWAGEALRQRGYPTTGELVQDVGELGEFGLAGGVAGKIKGMMKKPLPPAKYPTEGPPTPPPTDLLPSKVVADVERLAKAKKGEVSRAKVEANQGVVDLLEEKRAKVEGDSPKAGYQRGFYTKLAKTVAELDKNIEEVELSTIKGLKDPKGKTRQAIEEMLEIRKLKEPVAPVAPVESPKIPVTFIGLQENPKGEPLPLVNEPSGTTKVLDPTQHKIVNVEEFEAALKVEPPKVEETLEEKVARLESEVVEEVPPDAKGLRGNERRVPERRTIEERGPEESRQDLQRAGEEEGAKARGEEEARQIREEETANLEQLLNEEFELSRKIANLNEDIYRRKVERLSKETYLPEEAKVIEILEKELSDTVKKREDVRKQQKLVSEPAPPKVVEGRVPEPSSLEGPSEVGGVGSVLEAKEEVKAVQETRPKDYKTGTKAERDAAVAAAFEKYKAAKTAEINRVKESKVEPGDLGVLLDEFQTFASREEAIKLGKDPSRLVQDPLTKRWFEELRFEELEDLGWESDRGDLNLERGEVRWSDDLEVREGEVGEGRVKDLWDILGNERGSGPALVDPENLRVLRDKVKEQLRKAKKLGVSIEDYLTGLGASQKTREDFLRVVSQLEDINRKVKERNPIVEGIFNPKPEEVISQKVKASKRKKGTFLVEVPYTLEWEGRLRNTVKTMDRWPKNFIGNFMKFNEIPMKAFKRMGLDELWWDWVKQESRRMDWVRGVGKEFKALEKTFSKQEIREMSIVSEARQEFGPEILKSVGINEIPQLTPKQEAGLQRFRDLYDKVFEEVNYVRTHTGREPLPKEKNYFTRVRQLNILKSKGIIGALSNEPVERVSSLAREFKGKYNPYAEKRVKAADIPVELDIFSNLRRYVDFVSKDIYISPVAALAKKLSASKVRMDLKDLGKEGSYLASLHPGAAELLRRWSDEILGVHLLGEFYKEYAGLKATSDFLHRGVVAATILFSPITVAKQFSAWTGTIAEAGVYHTLKGIGRFATENPYALYKGEMTRARAKSDVLKIRGYIGESYFENLHEQWISGKIGRAREKVAKVGGFPMYLTDYVTAESSWNAFYSYAKSRKMSEAEAFRFAEDRTAKTQVVGVRGATAPIQNIPGLDLFTIFQTFAIGDFNYIARDLLKIKNPEPTNLKHFARVARYVVGAYCINSVFQAAGIDEPHPAPVETYKETKEKGGSERLAITKALVEYFEKLPQIGGVLKYGSPLGGPIADLMRDVPVAAQALMGAVDWDRMSKQQKVRTCLLIADVVGRSAGIPGTAPMLKSARTYAAGGNKWEVLMGIYIDSKKRHGRGRLPSLPRTP